MTVGDVARTLLHDEATLCIVLALYGIANPDDAEAWMPSYFRARAMHGGIQWAISRCLEVP